MVKSQIQGTKKCNEKFQDKIWSKLRCDTILSNCRMLKKKKIPLKWMLETIFISVVYTHAVVEAVYTRQRASDVWGFKKSAGHSMEKER